MYILFDIGGTNMRINCSRDGRKFCKPIKEHTPRDFKKAMELFSQIALDLAGGKKIKAVGGGVAGAFDKKHEKLVGGPNLRGWIGKPLKKTIEKKLKAQVFLQNDTAVIGLGEAVYGAGKKYDIVGYLTVSTGVGGARIVNKNFDTSLYNLEPGKQIIDIDKTLYKNCPGAGSLEQYIGGANIEKRYNRNPEDIKDKKIWDNTAYFLAAGLQNTIVHWSPEVVVLGGAMMEDIKITQVKKHLKKFLKIYPQTPEIKKFELGDRGGLYGALYMLKKIYKV